ncbi:formylglycine-generating enzyme family protein [Pedobacter borealis]|uniref:formylglycine-generating enzyme family protein n=1 Tax=Pedobacter borealis TaxID=475254 RepID=UPI00068F2E71|nr:SUMF1/EgtB/PvdO family nonheme iron enzyme [Pedobacter borealis]
MKKIILHSISFLFVFCCVKTQGQSLKSIELGQNKNKGLEIKSLNRFQTPGYEIPLVSFLVNDKPFSTTMGKAENGSVVFSNKLRINYTFEKADKWGIKAKITFVNEGKDTLRIGNIVPFGESEKHVYITAFGNDGLSRTHLFRPNYKPVNVIVPDNAWELGFATINCDNGNSFCALSRRDKSSVSNGEVRRFETKLNPEGDVTFNLWFADYIGTWQDGLRLMFQDRMLYDVEPGTFDNSMYEREDLKWVRNVYAGHFLAAWHSYFYDADKTAYQYEDFNKQIKQLYGGDDYTILWHGWPMVGMDQRNQFDVFKSLPKGIDGVRDQSRMALNKYNNKLFTAFMPWDLPAGTNQMYNSTRIEPLFDGLAKVVKQAELWGTMFDTRSESKVEMQQAVDAQRKGFVIFPEGMSVPRDMQNCIIGRVHAALSYPPMLNLNKLIKPDFTILRQAVLDTTTVKRDMSISFFSGYGAEMHLYISPKTDWVHDLYSYYGRMTQLLRNNHNCFQDKNYSPLIPTTVDDIWVNKWDNNNKTVYTIYSVDPKGHNGPLFEVLPETGYHFVDLWNNQELVPVSNGGKWLISASIDSFDAAYKGTNAEGEVGCIAKLPKFLESKKTNDNLSVNSSKGSSIKVWKGSPAYNKTPLTLPVGKYNLNIQKDLASYQGDIVVQLFDHDILLDELIVKGSKKEPVLVYRPFSEPADKTDYQSQNMNVKLERQNDLLFVNASEGEIKITAVDQMALAPLLLKSGNNRIKLFDVFGQYEGNFKIELYKNNKVIDNCIVGIPYGYLRLLHESTKTPKAARTPEGMAEIPSGTFVFKAEQKFHWFTKQPVEDTAKKVTLPRYFIDKKPVTNKQYQAFVKASNYKPKDGESYLKHWINGEIPQGQENYPVCYVALEDAKAYAAWAGKRLPTEKEWLYAAQGSDGRLWPWGNIPDEKGEKCNLGNGIPTAVGKYPQGANQFGVEDLTGCIWQMTNDEYFQGTTKIFIMKGGSYFKPEASWWYVEGGAKPLVRRQNQLRVSPGYERAATIGFRCVKDAE